MKKKIIIIVSIIVVLVLAVGSAYLIDKSRMANNKPVIFSTWGYQYAPPEVLKKIVKITDRTVIESLECADALEKFYEDSEYEYYFNCIKSEYIIVEYENGYKENVKSALESGNATLEDLKRFNISYFKEKKQLNEKQAVYNQSGDFLSVTLPEEWNYQIITDSNEQYEYSIKIYLDNSEKYAIVGSYEDRLGVCGTDLECEDLVSNDGIAINVGYYGNDWSFMTFGYEDKEIVAMNNGLKDKEAKKAIEILKTVKVDKKYEAVSSGENDGNNTSAYIPDGMDVVTKDDVGTKIEEITFNRDKEKVTIEVLMDTVTRNGATVVITDKNENPYGWGKSYKLQQKIADEWYNMAPHIEMIFEEIGYILNSNGQYTENIDWTRFYGEIGDISI